MSLPTRYLSPLTITRSSAGDYVNGRWLPSSTSPLTVQASIQPITGRELLRFPEGWRTREPVMVYTETELRTVDEAAKKQADTFAYNGRTYEVSKVEPWTMGGLSHYEVTALKVDETQTGGT